MGLPGMIPLRVCEGAGTVCQGRRLQCGPVFQREYLPGGFRTALRVQPRRAVLDPRKDLRGRLYASVSEIAADLPPGYLNGIALRLLEAERRDGIAHFRISDREAMIPAATSGLFMEYT